MPAAGQREGCSLPAGRIPPWPPTIPRKLPHRQIRKGLLLLWKKDTTGLNLWGDPGLRGILFEGIWGTGIGEMQIGAAGFALTIPVLVIFELVILVLVIPALVIFELVIFALITFGFVILLAWLYFLSPLPFH